MADIAVTAANVALTFPKEARRRNYIANAAITAGQALYLLNTGKVDLADANAAGKEQFVGIALEGAGAGQTVSVCEIGDLSANGFDLSGLAWGALVYLSDTAGALADAASATKTVVVGQVRPITTVGGFNKQLYVRSDPTKVW